MVYDPGSKIDDASDDRYKIFNSGNSNLPSNIINAIATDEDGGVWIGTTNNGVIVFECQDQVFDAACKGTKRVFCATRPGGNLLDKADSAMHRY